MKNRNILHSRQEIKIYADYYKPSFNLWRFTKSILGVLIYGSSTVGSHYASPRKRIMR